MKVYAGVSALLGGLAARLGRRNILALRTSERTSDAGTQEAVHNAAVGIRAALDRRSRGFGRSCPRRASFTMLTYSALSSFLPPRAAPAPVLPRGGRPVASLTGLRSGYLGRGTSWDAYGLTMAPDPNDPPEVDPRRKDPTTPSPRPFVPLPVVGDGNTQMDVISRLLRDRILLLGQQVDDEIGNLIVAQLLYLANEDAEKDVTLYINSPGGSVSAGMAMFDTMQYVPCGARALDSHPRAPRGARPPLSLAPPSPFPSMLPPLPRATRRRPAAPRRAADINTVAGTAARWAPSCSARAARGAAACQTRGS